MDSRVIVVERISDEGMEALAGAVEAVPAFAIERDELLDLIDGFDGMIIRSHTLIDRELLDRGARLRVVGRAGVGVDNIDIPYATSAGVMIVNAPESNIVSAAEHTMALMLALARRLPIANAELKRGVWRRAAHRGVELFGKTLGIVGLGRVGSTVAVRAASFGMKIIAYDPYISHERFEMFGVERMETLDDLLVRSDYISVHTPKTEETYGMIGERELGVAPQGVRVVNTARGGIVNEAALVGALESRKVAGAGVDVFDGEPVERHRLFEFDQVVVTPHLGGSTVEAQTRVGETVAEQVIEALGGKLPKYALNIPHPDPETFSFVRPFLPLAELMGSFYTQLFGLPAEGVTIHYGGEIGRYSTDLPTAMFLKGLMKPALGDAVNLVNVRVLAESRGLRVTESRSTRDSTFANLVTVRGLADSGRTLSGTLLRDGDFRIVEIDGFEVDVPLVGDVIVSWHSGSAVGQPGVVGRVGMMLGDAGVNISRMEVGREIINDRAIMVISRSGGTPKEATQRLAAMPGVVEARFATFPVQGS